MSGGMYVILKVIYEIHINDFTSKDLEEHLDISRVSIGQNLKRLVSIGVLIKEDYRHKETGCRQVRYKINKELIEYVYRTLYN